MMELGRKEQHLLGGIGFNILIVGLLVFAYTQAVRQVNLSKDLSLRLREQLTVAREQLARQSGRTDLAQVQAQVAKLKGSMVSPDGLGAQAARLERLASEQFGVEGKITVSDQPVQKVSVPLEGQPALEILLHSLEMKGTAQTRALAGLAAAVGDPAFRPVCPLVGMELHPAGPTENRPVEFLLKWLVAVSPDSPAPAQQALPAAGSRIVWGPREEPFLSPFSHPNALRLPTERQASLQLSGIVQQEGSFTCIINNQVLKPGDLVGGYQVLLITPNAVLLEGKGEELLLRLP
ncbi:MAG: hypothetical protein Q7J69_05555 [Candidatus Omnitrophota bacterium]|nr:hypothetical protein [Candidatus Omnitrophota bacterium]